MGLGDGAHHPVLRMPEAQHRTDSRALGGSRGSGQGCSPRKAVLSVHSFPPDSGDVSLSTLASQNIKRTWSRYTDAHLQTRRERALVEIAAFER